MKSRHVGQSILTGLFLLFTLAYPASTRADGGIIVDDPVVWAELEEGIQTAIVQLGEGDTAQVDLFVSLHDASGESHEVTFFVPLGAQPSAFDVVEESSHAFEGLHAELDDRLLTAARYKHDIQRSLAPGFLLVHGAIFGPFLLFTGCGTQGAEPVATFETEHSIVELYDIDAETDLAALATTTGLDPAVQETLRRLEGQQIAVVTLQTQPIGGDDEGEAGYGYIEPDDLQGLRLSWTAGLVPGEKGKTYSYPLGTGGAWARPIDQTSVYVVAPSGVDFDITYPKLGLDRSGYDFNSYWSSLPRILFHTDSPGYAVDQAVGDFGRIWRAIYVQSNAVEDIVITRVERLRLQTHADLLQNAIGPWATRVTWVIGLLAALVLWVTAWRFVMSRRLGFSYSHWFDGRLWGQGVTWIGIYVLSTTGAAIVACPCVALTALSEGLMSGWILLLLLSLAITSWLFGRHTGEKQGVPRDEAALAYLSVAILSNIGYGLFALIYLALVGGL